ncbi:hypothetical protein ACIOD0_16425 [Kitasatospora albolonga]|uniref:Uncharacterized protein n=2 Tax=Streptomycetaceae TaxID=2062 RepID=A0ABU2VVN0_9ACTN|nr:hypothetical protein [Streptomyces griseus]ARF77312.1 hypothetical protein B7C62_21575 [Kitasatospora albolonga]MDT0489358.1 hypothetical protein [Streptomyces griseus]
MYGENKCPNPQEPPRVPNRGAVMVDTSLGDRVGEFRGLAGPYWSLRPIGGGREWTARPQDVRPALPIEEIRAKNNRMNARSRGEVL